MLYRSQRWQFRPPLSARGVTGHRGARRRRHDGNNIQRRLESTSGTARDERQRDSRALRPTETSTKVRTSFLTWYSTCPRAFLYVRRRSPPRSFPPEAHLLYLVVAPCTLKRYPLERYAVRQSALRAETLTHLASRTRTHTRRMRSTTDDDDMDSELSEVDSLFALLAARRRGEMLFAEEMRKNDEDVDFLRAASYVAMHRRPDLGRVEDARLELDELAAELEKILPPMEERFPLRTLTSISKYLFVTLGFKGNDEEFYDPRNSCVDEVLARRVGIPITLSLIYMELARRVGLPMVGVNLPSRFMIRPVIEDMEVLVDCFEGGEIKFVEDVEEMLGGFYGSSASGDPRDWGNGTGKNTLDGGSEPPPAVRVTIDRGFFADRAARPKQFFTRLLTNLKQIYFNRGEYDEALRIVGYQNHCAPTEEIKRFNRRDGGICLFLMRRYDEAAEELNGYVRDAALAEAEEDEVWRRRSGREGRAKEEEERARAETRAARRKDRERVLLMVQTAIERSRQIAAEAMVANMPSDLPANVETNAPPRADSANGSEEASRDGKDASGRLKKTSRDAADAADAADDDD